MSAGRILVVDDQPQMRRFMRSTLTSAGYEIDDAKTGEEALIKLRDFHPDLVVLDLGLPKLSGFDVLENCQLAGVPVVVFSGSSNEADRRRVIELGACEFVQKPAAFNDYQETVRRFCQKWGRSKREND